MLPWIKAAGIAVPVIVAGSICAFASGTSHSSTSAAVSRPKTVSNKPVTTSTNDNVTITLDKSESLSSFAHDSMGINASPKQHILTRGMSPSVSDAMSPLPSALLGVTATQIQHLHVQLKQGQQDVDIDYHSDPNRNIHLDGHVGRRPIHLTGGNATQAVDRLISQWDVLNILQQVVANGSVGIRIPFQHVELQTFDGTHIDLNQDGHFHIDANPRH